MTAPIPKFLCNFTGGHCPSGCARPCVYKIGDATREYNVPDGELPAFPFVESPESRKAAARSAVLAASVLANMLDHPHGIAIADGKYQVVRF